MPGRVLGEGGLLDPEGEVLAGQIDVVGGPGEVLGRPPGGERREDVAGHEGVEAGPVDDGGGLTEAAAADVAVPLPL